MECPMVINKIVFTSPEVMVQFSGEKHKISTLTQNPFNLRKFIFAWKVNEKTSSLSPITNHAKMLCKECETKSLTIQAIGQLWITQSVMFPGNVYSPNVVAKYYVMFLWEQELKERSFKFFKLLVRIHCSWLDKLIAKFKCLGAAFTTSWYIGIQHWHATPTSTHH